MAQGFTLGLTAEGAGGGCVAGGGCKCMLAAAGCHGQRHNENQQHCNPFFHRLFSLSSVLFPEKGNFSIGDVTIIVSDRQSIVN
jgi:hypothetical protein